MMTAEPDHKGASNILFWRSVGRTKPKLPTRPEPIFNQQRGPSKPPFQYTADRNWGRQIRATTRDGIRKEDEAMLDAVEGGIQAGSDEFHPFNQ